MYTSAIINRQQIKKELKNDWLTREKSSVTVKFNYLPVTVTGILQELFRSLARNTVILML